MRLKSPGNEPVKVGLLSGHVINIPPEGRDVPQRFIRDAFQAGCLPVEVDADKVEDNTPTPDGKDRQDLILEAIKVIVASGEDLTTEGFPNLKHLSKVVGFTVNRKEMVDAWNILSDMADQSVDGEGNGEEA